MTPPPPVGPATGARLSGRPRAGRGPAAAPAPEASRYASLRAHIVESVAAICHLDEHVARLDAWADELASVLGAGGRVLAAGNGGSAALAQHLTAELVGRFRDDRPAFSALALHAETSSVTAIANDYGYETVFARQVEAHGRPGDILILMSTSGCSTNLLAAADAGRRQGLRCLALTGPAPNPLALRCHETVALDVASAPAVQDAQQVAVHLLCTAFDRRAPQA